MSIDPSATLPSLSTILFDAMAARIKLGQTRATIVEQLTSAVDEVLAMLGWTDPLPKVCANLTPREKEVAALLIQGLPNKELGRRLGTTEGTIKVHVKSLMTKFNCTSRTGVVAAILRLGPNFQEFTK